MFRYLTKQAACACLLLALALSTGCSLKGSQGGGGSGAGSAVSKTALSTVGTPYKYGGATPATGFDCSGLVSWSYKKHGVSVPRTAKEQSRMGRSVSKGGLKPGDVVVFKLRSGLHTGIYTGNGRFVHSPSSGKRVRVDNIHADYWKKCFIAGRRPNQG